MIVPSDDLLLSTVLVAPTSTSAQGRVFRPTIRIGDDETRVLLEQAAAVAPDRLGPLVGHLTRPELVAVDDALRLAFGLD